MTHTTKGRATDIDIYVGARIRTRRALMGISQEQMAKAIGLTFQQIQKYEKGTNRVSAGRLYVIAKFFGLPMAYFFPGDLPKRDESTVQNPRQLVRTLAKIRKLVGEVEL